MVVAAGHDQGGAADRRDRLGQLPVALGQDPIRQGIDLGVVGENPTAHPLEHLRVFGAIGRGGLALMKAETVTQFVRSAMSHLSDFEEMLKDEVGE